MADTENIPERTANPSEAKAPAVASADVAASGASADGSGAEKAEMTSDSCDTPPMVAMDDKNLDKGLRHRGRLQSKKLDRTLAELESAFSDWDSIISDGAPSEAEATEVAQTKTGSVGKDADNAEFKKRTRHLLIQLRQQLREL